MEEHSQHTKIGRSWHNWYILPVLAGVGLLITLMLTTQTPASPAPEPTQQAAITPSTPLGDQQLLLVGSKAELKFWDGVNQPEPRGTLAAWNVTITLDREREVLLSRNSVWLEARSLRDNQRLWHVPIHSQAAQFETTIVDVVHDPFAQLVWLLEKQTTNDPFQPATVRLRGLDSRSGVVLRQYQAPLVHEQPQVLPTAAGPWLLADGQLFGFDAARDGFGEPFFSQLEFAAVAADGQRALVFGAGIISEIDLLKRQTLNQTEFSHLAQLDRLQQLVVSPDLKTVVVVIDSSDTLGSALEIFAYDRAGNPLGLWQRPLVYYGDYSEHRDGRQRIRFLDNQHLILLHNTDLFEIIELATDQSFFMDLATSPMAEQPNYASFALIPKRSLMPAVDPPALKPVDSAIAAKAPLAPVPLAVQPLALLNDEEQTRQLTTEGLRGIWQQANIYSLARWNAAPLLIARADASLQILDPTNQTTITLDLELANVLGWSDLEGVSAPDNRSILLCYSYRFDMNEDSRFNQCLAFDLQTGQTRIFAELPDATYLTPIYWDGQQATIVGYTPGFGNDRYLVWQASANEPSQATHLLDSADMLQLWYMAGAPTVVYRDWDDQLQSYSILAHQAQMLMPTSNTKALGIDIAPDGQTMMLFERSYPWRYGTLLMFDSSTGLELWRDQLRQFQGQWSGDSNVYFIGQSHAINSRLVSVSRQGRLGESLLLADEFTLRKSDWFGQRLALQLNADLYLVERIDQHWLALASFSGIVRSTWLYVFKVIYVYPQP
ncbi:hypothetical protein [Herpetosiphon sp. NSE202]|uniref:hypothetical protein n=1 Tax=Herpetosiphon sp. NSE202 TaxID=3351349 RepID=UPI00362DE761